MVIVLMIWGLLFGISGMMEFVTATAVFQQIVSGLLVLIATVSIGCGAIVEAVNRLRKQQASEKEVKADQSVTSHFHPELPVEEPIKPQWG